MWTLCKLRCNKTHLISLTFTWLPIKVRFCILNSISLFHWQKVKMDDASPLSPAVQKRSQDIPDMSAAILCWSRGLESELKQCASGRAALFKFPPSIASRTQLSIVTFFQHQITNDSFYPVTHLCKSHSDIWPPNSNQFIIRDLSAMPWRNFFKFGTNIHLDSRVNPLDFSDQRLTLKGDVGDSGERLLTVESHYQVVKFVQFCPETYRLFSIRWTVSLSYLSSMMSPVRDLKKRQA